MENKKSRYFKYAIGEIILVVIGILIALQINNWNENQKETKQINAIFKRIVQDFNNNSTEITEGVNQMKNNREKIDEILYNSIDKDSLLYNQKYLDKYITSFGGFPDIKIHDDGINLLKTKIQNNYDLNYNLIEDLLKLYSEFLYEIEIDSDDLGRMFTILYDYKISTGAFYSYEIKNDKSKIISMILNDEVFKTHLNEYSNTLRMNVNNLQYFQKRGQELMGKIKVNYRLN
jgi:hypothetical protein